MMRTEKCGIIMFGKYLLLTTYLILYFEESYVCTMYVYIINLVDLSNKISNIFYSTKCIRHLQM